MSKLAQDVQRQVDAIYGRTTAPTLAKVKGRKARAEKTVKTDIRAKCAARDGDCRLAKAGLGDTLIGDLDNCDGQAEWAHLNDKRRSKTRGQSPEIRHTTIDSVILCRRHHAEYDGRARPRIEINKLTKRGADGPLRFVRRTT